ncbi:hypothetical protein BH10BAC2_BH10BAC2_32590 [soil metagenome]
MKRAHTLMLYLAIWACLLIFPLNKVAAQAPANDNCTGATLISTIPYNDLTTSYTNASTTGATRSNPNPSCITSSDNNDDIWYKFVAVTQTELLRVQSVVSGSSYTTLGYALYDGCGGTQITCNNQMGTFYGNEMLGGLTPGNTYYLRFWSQNNFTFMTFSFAVMDISPLTPGNSTGAATVLSINDPGALCISPQFYTTASATRDSPDPLCSSDNDDDVWFRFTCPANGVDIYPEEGALITTGGFANMGMEIIDATNGISQSCTANYGVGSTTSFSGVTGRDYYIRIWTMGLAERAVFSLCLQQGFNNFPVNNTCASATVLSVGAGVCTTPVIGNLYNADFTAALTGNPSCTVNTTLINDVWYSATVPASGNLVVQTSATHSAVNDLVLLAYTTSNCTAFTQISCDEDGNTAAFPSAHHARISLSGRTPGETIYFRVLPRNSNNKGQFSICAFDETAGATPTISITNVSKTEGNSGNKLFDFSVTLSSASTDTVQVKYKTVDISATGGVDYVSVPVKTLLTFNPGETAKTVNITVNGDTAVESNETFKVKLSDAINATIADNTGKGTIRNDDGALAILATGNENILSEPKKEKISIYPNPVADKLNISLPTNGYACSITLTDITGRIIRVVKAGHEQKIISIKMNDLSKGVYLLKVISGNSYETFKIVKQ